MLRVHKIVAIQKLGAIDLQSKLTLCAAGQPALPKRCRQHHRFSVGHLVQFHTVDEKFKKHACRVRPKTVGGIGRVDALGQQGKMG